MFKQADYPYKKNTTLNGLAVLMRMVKILRGAHERKNTAEMRTRMMFVFLLLRAFLIVLDEDLDWMIFFVEA